MSYHCQNYPPKGHDVCSLDTKFGRQHIIEAILRRRTTAGGKRSGLVKPCRLYRSCIHRLGEACSRPASFRRPVATILPNNSLRDYFSGHACHADYRQLCTSFEASQRCSGHRFLARHASHLVEVPSMLFQRPTFLRLATLALLLVSTLSIEAHAQQGWEAISDTFRKAGQIAHRKKPKIQHHDCWSDIAKQVDWLEHQIDAYGSVVPKHPDIWGEARLTRHRHEYERELARRFDESRFDAGLQGALRRSDQAALAIALSVDDAAQGAESSSSASNAAVNLLPDIPIERSKGTGSQIDLKNFEEQKISLDPTVELDQLSRYLSHLNELRRINEGGDTADSPGYSLNLIRIPVSVLPGKRTRTGYGAEITFTLEPYLTEELLPSTFRNLVINDVVDQLGLPVTQLITVKNTRDQLTAFIEQANEINQALSQVDRFIGLLNSPITSDQKEKIFVELEHMYDELRRRLTQAHENEKDEKRKKYLAGLLEKFPDGFDNYRAQAIARLLKRNDIPYKPSEVETYQEATATFLRLQKDNTLKSKLGRYSNQDVGSWTFREDLFERLADIKVQLGQVYAELSNTSPQAAMSSSPRGRRSLLPIAPAHVDEIFGTSGNVIGHIALEAYSALSDRPDEEIKLTDVESYLRVELEAAYDFLQDESGRLLQQHCTPKLVRAVRTRRRRMVIATPKRPRNDDVEEGYAKDEDAFREPGKGLGLRQMLDEFDWPVFANRNRPLPRKSPTIEMRNEETIIELRNQFLEDLAYRYPRVSYSSTASLAWAVIVESALLNARLAEDMHEAAVEKGCPVTVDKNDWLDAFMPQPSPQAIESFNAYVQCRWPIQVFALDPVTQDQNIADVFSRRREMQVALAVGVAQGNVRPSAAARFARRLETDMETIALNRTIVGFSHGSKVFGWRFYPRFQTPPTPGTLGALGETILGGPSRDKDLRGRQLESGMRECVAIVAMPSFVPYATVESRANWFGLKNPAKKELTMHQTLQLGKAHEAILRELACCRNECGLRPLDTAGVLRTLDHLEARLPVQTAQLQLPFENTLGGFELFASGVTDLAPELRGFYGARGIVVDDKHTCPDADKDTGVKFAGDQCKSTCTGTTLFLVGDNYSVHDTKVIAGGKCVPFVQMSRQILRITVPPNVTLAKDRDDKQGVVVHVATPYGVSNRLFIPIQPKKTDEAELKKKLDDLKADITSHNFSIIDKQKMSLAYEFDKANLSVTGTELAGGTKHPSIKFNYGDRLFEKEGVTHPSFLKLGVTIKYDGKFLGPVRTVNGELVVKPSSSDQLRKAGQFTVGAQDVLNSLKSDLAKITRPNVKDLKKFQAEAHFYLMLTGGNGLPIQIKGKLPLELHERPKKEAAEGLATAVRIQPPLPRTANLPSRLR